MHKIKISMIRYGGNGKPVDIAYGDYKQQDVEMFRRDGFVDADEGLVRS